MDLSQWESYTARRRAKAWTSIQVLWQGVGQRQGKGVAFQHRAINDAAVTFETLVSWKAVHWYHKILHGPTCDPKHMCHLFDERKQVFMYWRHRLASTNELAASRLVSTIRVGGIPPQQLKIATSAQMRCRLPALSARMSWRLPALEDMCWRHPALTLFRNLSHMLIIALLSLVASRLPDMLLAVPRAQGMLLAASRLPSTLLGGERKLLAVSRRYAYSRCGGCWWHPGLCV